jgi:hypothetical protein
MVGEKAPMLGRAFRLDASAGFGKRAGMRFRAPPLALPVAGMGLSTTFLRAPCLDADSFMLRQPSRAALKYALL